MPGTETDHGVGRILGDRYRLEKCIGVGASAMVYQATDLNLRRSVAVKQVKPELSGDIRFLKLFRSEAHLAGQLDHPNVLTIHDWSADEDGDDGGAYIVTEHLTGGNLRQFLDRNGPLPVGDIARIGLQVAQGLRAAHTAALVHRDIKPGNLLFGADGRVRIVDFGIARAVAEAAWTEPEGHLIGTARYAAPEQAEAGEINGRADVYSLAICLTEMAIGEVPLVGESALATMMLRRDVGLGVEPALGPLGDLVAWAGTAHWEDRPSADQLVGELAAIQGMTGLDLVTVIDLTANQQANEGDPAREGQVSNPPDLDDGPGRDDTGARIGARVEAELRVGPGSGAGADGWDEAVDQTDLAVGPLGVGGPADGVEAGGATEIIAAEGRAGAPGQSQMESVALGDRTEDGYLRADDTDDGGRWRRRWAIGMALFILATIVAAAGGWFLAGARQPVTEVVELGLPSWPVPDFTGLDEIEAAEAAAANGWSVVVDERHADGTAVGQLLEQRPAVGEIRGPGATVELVLSLGPVPREVPELVGLTEDEANQALASARLVVGEVTEATSEEVDASIVLSATVEGRPVTAGAEHATGTAVDLVLSSGPALRVVPDLAGSTIDEAQAALVGLGLVVATAEDHSESVAEGQIISTSPAAGDEVPRDSTVTITVSLGLPLIEIPNLAGTPVLEAADQLSALGFTVRIEGAVEADVLGTRPQAGTAARQGASITIVSTQE